MIEPGDLEEREEFMGVGGGYGGLADDAMDIEDGAQSDAVKGLQKSRETALTCHIGKRGMPKQFLTNVKWTWLFAFIQLG
jgi:hypothetical protein